MGARFIWIGAALALLASGAEAAPIDVNFTFNFRDFRTTNNAGVFAGDRLLVGIDVTPNPATGDPGTAIVARQGATELGLFYLASPGIPDQFANSIAYDPSLTGQWTLTVTNPDSANSPQTAVTHSIGPGVGTTELISNLAQTAFGATPTFTWNSPSGEFDRTRIFIHDRDAQAPGGLAPIVSTTVLSGNPESFTAPEAWNLRRDGNYTINIALEQVGPSGTLSRSNYYYDFTTDEQNGGQSVFLPIVDPNGGPNGGPTYLFNIDVESGELIYIDPEIAVGYDYATGAGDPDFASVELPDIGDGEYELWLFDARGNPFDTGIDLFADVLFDFTTIAAGGVDRFRILGIEAEAGLDPLDATAFVTGLTFIADGRFTGTMTPLTVETPEPAALGLLGLGLASLRLMRRRRGS